MKNIFYAILAAAILCACQHSGSKTAESTCTSIPTISDESPLRLAVAGVTHGHLAQVRIRVGRGDFDVVGVWEENDEYRENNELSALVPGERFYASLEQMLDETKPEVVVAYGSSYEHLRVVKACAPRGIHVMVEKPLATTVKQAEEIAKLARKYGIQVLVNYETTWYASNTYVKKAVDEGRYGKINRIEVYDGHGGPVEIRCEKRFLDWLTDPVLNGAGALFDFGCYGANLATWIFNGKQPLRVSAVVKTNKPDVYPKVDDDASVMVEYDDAVVQINASWCWPFGRKDMWVYGMEGSVYQENDTRLMERSDAWGSRNFEPPALEYPYNDSFYWLKAVIRGEIQLDPWDQQALENNITVVKILEAAKKSAASGKAERIR